MNEKVVSIMDDLEKWTDSAALSLNSTETQAKLKEVLEFASKFWRYSWHNWMLIYMQRKNASLVKGFNGWKEVGRYVKKGEKAIGILAPRIGKREDSNGEKQSFLAGFIGVSVFDVSQTDGQNIVVNANNEANGRFCSMVHELAHNVCHFKTKRKEEGKVTKCQMEVEAELTSFLVGKHFGYESRDAVAYMANWKATGEALREALKVVSKLTKEIITALEE